MIPVITKTKHEYDGLNREEGDEYDCHPEHVPLLIGMGFVETREHYESMPAARALDINSDAVAYLGRGRPILKLKRVAH